MVALCACNNDDYSLEYSKTKRITFSIEGEFTLTPMTRAAIEVDGKIMTDIWILDYMGNELIQQIHQTSDMEDFGTPTLDLKYGSHHLYCVVSRGQNPVLNTTDKTITFSKVLDTFYKDYSIDVVSTSNGNKSITLDRAVTKLKVIFSDAIPEGATKFEITPETWYYGINYTNGNAIASSDNPITVNIPNSSIGKTGESLNIYGFSPVTEWTTNITLQSYAGEIVIGEAHLADVPLKRNRATEYTGLLYGSNGAGTFMFNAEWETSTTGTW